MTITLEPIAIVRSCFKEKFGIPRQAGLAPHACAELVVEPAFADMQAFAELRECSHIWLQFIFHQNKHYRWQPRVRPPRLGGNASLGVFASRSPYRPNALGLSAVKLEAIQQREKELVLMVSGVDLLEGTPIVDIKPYVPYADCISQANNYIAADAPQKIPVQFSEHSAVFCNNYLNQHQVSLQQLIEEVLSQDPRPKYHQFDKQRHYGVRLLDVDIRWRLLQKDGAETICVESIRAIIE